MISSPSHVPSTLTRRLANVTKVGQLLIADPIHLRVGDEHELGAALETAEHAFTLGCVESCGEPMLVVAEAVANDADRQYRRWTKPKAHESSANHGNEQGPVIGLAAIPSRRYPKHLAMRLHSPDIAGHSTSRAGLRRAKVPSLARGFVDPGRAPSRIAAVVLENGLDGCRIGADPGALGIGRMLEAVANTPATFHVADRLGWNTLDA